MSRLVAKVFNAGSYTWTAPPGVFSIILMGSGGGGGGGSGADGYNTGGTRRGGQAGLGGAAAIVSTMFISVVPGTSYAISVGAGGLAGTAHVYGTYGSSGLQGGDSTFGGFITFRGGDGGLAATGTTVATGVDSDDSGTTPYHGMFDMIATNGFFILPDWGSGGGCRLHGDGRSGFNSPATASFSSAYGGTITQFSGNLKAGGGGGGGISGWPKPLSSVSLSASFGGNGGTAYDNAFNVPTPLPGVSGDRGCGGGGGGGGGVDYPSGTVINGGHGGAGGGGGIVVMWVE